jgi:signal transduction histidine kinase
MGHPIQRIPRPIEADVPGRAVDRARLLERIAVGLAHEGKNPLHNMVLHLQLLSEKIASPGRQGDSPIEKHLAAMRDGIGRVDDLLRAFGEFAAAQSLPPDLGAAVRRAVQLFAYDVRRAAVKVSQRGPEALVVESSSLVLGDLVAHAFLACLELARDGGAVDIQLEPRGAAAVLELRAGGGLGNRGQAQPHLEALRSLAPQAACELSVETPAAGGAWLSLSFPHRR